VATVAATFFSVADLDEQGRPKPPLTGDELTTLLGFLDYQRATFEWKSSGLGQAGLTVSVGASSMTLGGMLKHLAHVEDSWFSQWLHARDPVPPWDTVDWAADPEWEWHTAATDTPDDLRVLWRQAVTRSRCLVQEALAEGGLDQRAQRSRPDGWSPSLRWILCHMTGEYARHNGHADLIRETIDGLTGE
jgi:uncharacterized damage-inducible protein DinB